MIRTLLLPLLVLLGTGAGHAADLQVSLPTITAPPGASVFVPITVSPDAGGLGIVSVDFVLPLNASVLSASASRPDGFLQTWGSPFVSATPSQLAAAAAGVTPVGGTATLLNTLELTVRADAVVGTDMPLVFTRVRFNEGTPSVELLPGLLRVRANVGVENAPAAGLSLRVVGAQPAVGPVRLAFRLPRAGDADVTLHDLLGRRVRTLHRGPSEAGAHEVAWDGRDDEGRPVPAGVLLALLRSESGTTTARVLRIR